MDEADPLRLFCLQGRVAFLSGATGWLGRVMASGLAHAGAHVILNARTQKALDLLAIELAGAGVNVSTACFDVTDESALRTNIQEIERKHGELHILVNNATSGRAGNLTSDSTSDFDRAFKVNVTAAFHLLQQLMPLLKKGAAKCTGGASVVNIASMYGVASPNPSVYGASGMDNPPSYGAAKAALIQFTRYAACHLAMQRVRVNCLSPGPFPSPSAFERDPEFKDRLVQKVPMMRIGSPCELVGPLLFLASDASSYITGANLPVDGGWTAW